MDPGARLSGGSDSPFHDPGLAMPLHRPQWEDPAGVPIDAFLFGGRRATAVPLIAEAFDWEHGTFLGATMSVETTAAAAGEVGQLRFDPMAMLPFCGYNMADYFGHWVKLGEREGAKLPKVFLVNWFRKDDEGKFIWPGYGENSRVLESIFRRCNGEGERSSRRSGCCPPPASSTSTGSISRRRRSRSCSRSSLSCSSSSCRRSRSTSIASATSCRSSCRISWRASRRA